MECSPNESKADFKQLVLVITRQEQKFVKKKRIQFSDQVAVFEKGLFDKHEPDGI
jgi:hypothetical protein